MIFLLCLLLMMEERRKQEICPKCKSEKIIVGRENGILEYDCEKCRHHWVN